MDVLTGLGSIADSRGRVMSPLVAWPFALPFALLVVLANFTYNFSTRVAFRTEFLAIPLAVWIAHRYGRYGFRVFALGGIVLWLEVRFGNYGTSLSPDVYLVALLAALAVAYPQRWLALLERTRASAGILLLLFGLLPILIIFRIDALGLGWNPGIFLGFCFFFLGYSGTHVRKVLWYLAGFSLIGQVLMSLELYIKDSGFQLYYSLIGVKGMLIHTIWLLGGALLHEARTNANRGPVLTDIWSRRPYTIYIAGLIMMLAPLFIGIKLWDIGMPLWGSKWLLVFGAFIAGVLWKQTGIQLTFAAIGGASILTMLVVPGLSDYLFINTPDFGISIRHSIRSFPQEALFALLYAIIGSRASGFLLTHSRENPASSQREQLGDDGTNPYG